MKLSSIVNKKVALLLMGKDRRGANDWRIFLCVIRRKGGQLVAAAQKGKGAIPLCSDWLKRLRKVEPEYRDLFEGVEYYLPLRIGPLPKGMDRKGLISTGFIWRL